jgi:hypothetical protein
MEVRQYMTKVLDHCSPEDRTFYNSVRSVEASIEAILALPDIDDATKDKTIQAVIGATNHLFSPSPTLGLAEKHPATLELAVAEPSSSKDPPVARSLLDELDAQLDQKFGKWVISSSDDD